MLRLRTIASLERTAQSLKRGPRTRASWFARRTNIGPPTFEPYAAGLLRDERDNIVQALGREALTFASTVARLPQRLDALTDRIEEGRLVANSPRIEQRLARLERTARRIVSAVVFVVLFIGGILLRVDEPMWGGALIGVSVIPLLHAMFAGVFRRRGRG